MAKPKWLSVAQVAERLGLPRSTVYDLLDRREIASSRHGRRRLVAEPDLEAYEAARRTPAKERPQPPAPPPAPVQPPPTAAQPPRPRRRSRLIGPAWNRSRRAA